MAAKKTASGGSVLDSTVANLEKALGTIVKAFAQIEAMTSQFPQLTPEERSTSLGRLRDGESKAILDLCSVMDTFPTHFVAMAAQDLGDDDTTIETGPTRANIARRDALAPLAVKAQEVADRISDALLVLGDRARQVSIPAYRIATTAAKTDKSLRSKLTPVTTHYGAGARKAKATIKRKKGASK